MATLIFAPAAAAASQRLAHTASAALGASTVDWLARDIACDIAIAPGIEAAAAGDRLRQVVEGFPADVAIQDAAGRRKKLLIADMDSTMIGQECIDELAAEIGARDAVAAITVRAMNGEIAFEPALRERVALLEGLPARIIAKVIEERITPASGARTLVETMNAAGAHTALVSGGFDAFTGPIAGMLGFREHRANRLTERDGVLTGTVEAPILGRAAKASALAEIAARLGIGLDEVIAVGDGANDLDMIGMAGMGVALHAKPAVAAQAGIRIDHGDLTALLYLQGYRRSEFVAG